MRSFKNYKNYRTQAKLIAWLMDLLLHPIYWVLTIFFWKDRLKSKKIERILLVRLDHMGDLLMSTPAISSLRKKFPEARIDLLAGEKARDVFRGNRDIDDIITFKASWYDPRRGGEIWPVDVVRTILKLRRAKYHVGVDLRGDFRIILFLWLAGIPRRIGFRNLGLEFLLTETVAYDPDKNHLDLNFDALSPFHIEQREKRIKFFVDEKDETYIDELLRENGIQNGDRIVGMNPTTNRIEQRWDERKFAKVADRLIEEFHVKVLLISAKTEAAWARLMIRHTKQRIIDLIGKTTIGQLGALMKRLSLYIANDSGSMHLAISLKTPTIGIFGPTSVRKSWPYNRSSPFFRPIEAEIDCQRPCYARDCFPKTCLELITVEEVYEAARNILNQTSFSFLEPKEERT